MLLELEWLRVVFPFSHIVPIYERKGTGDEWSETQINQLQETFTSELRALGVVMADGSYRLEYSQVAEGRYRFWSRAEVDRLFWTFRWHQAAQEFSQYATSPGKLPSSFLLIFSR